MPKPPPSRGPIETAQVDPDDHRMVWAGVEIDGVFRSLDGGDTWTHLETGLYDPDIHAVTIAATQPKRLCASTAREVGISCDVQGQVQLSGSGDQCFIRFELPKS
jgi:hypothetical protein